MNNSMQLPPGHRLVTCLSYSMPQGFHALQRVRVRHRKWWQFWRPKFIYAYTRVKKTHAHHI